MRLSSNFGDKYRNGLMKYIYYKFCLWFFCVALFTSKMQAQFVTIPDNEFVYALHYIGLTSCLNGNQLDTTCPGVINYTGFSVTGFNISSLEGIQYFDNLTELMCSGNNLTAFPPLPKALRVLYCDGNPLVTLPDLPVSLRVLICDNTNLTELPTLPDSLYTLICFRCQLTTLPPLPDSLVGLDCALNQLTSLPALPASLNYLDCQFNNLTGLPVLPSSLRFLYSSNNDLTSLPEFPDFVEEFWCYNNPNLSCIPLIKKIDNFRFDSTAIACVPNYGDVLYSYPAINSLPLCTSFNPNQCPLYNSVNEVDFTSFQLKPNPATTKLTCAFTSHSPKTTLQVLSMDGRALRQPIPTTQNQTEIDVSYLPAGLYFLVLQSEGQRAVKKFIKE